jgi:hypothetical protein
MIQERQFIASIVIGFSLLVLIIRLVQKKKLDIAYCWVWLAIGIGMVLVVTRYEALTALSRLIGAQTHTTTLFLLGFVVILLLCLQFSLAISTHRRHLKELTQQLAILKERLMAQETDDTGQEEKPQAADG